MEILYILRSLKLLSILISLNFTNISCDDSPNYLEESCGDRPKSARINRIVGGSDTFYGEVPWQVLLQEKVDNAIMICGAVLIHHKWIITAAHCIRNKGTIKVFFGKHRLTDGITRSDFDFDDLDDNKNNKSDILVKWLTSGQRPVTVTRSAAKIIVNEKFNQKTFENDIALIMLNETIKYEDNIQPICLPKQMDDFSGQMGHVSGFGLLEYGSKQMPTILQIVSVPIMPTDFCKDMLEKLGYNDVVKYGILCAGAIDGGKDACAGDSGGPLTVQRSEDSKWVLVGIVSNGIRCGQPNIPGIYTQVSAYVDWIHQVMDSNT